MTETAKRSRWDTLRRRVAPVAFFVALAFLASRTCAADVAQVDIVFDFGTAGSQVRSLRAELFRHGEDRSVAVFTRHFGASGATDSPRIQAQLDPGTYRVHFEVDTAGSQKRFERVMEAGNTAVIRMNLERDLVP